MKNKSGFTWTPANIVTYIGMILVIISYYQLLVGNLLTGVIFYIIAALTDSLDGFIARNKLIKKLTGRGVSNHGKLIDPVRDMMLRAVIFILAYINGISQIGPTVVALIALGTFLLFNKNINKRKGEVVVTVAGKTMQFIDCVLLIAWIIIMLFLPEHSHETSVIIIYSMIITAGGRFVSYAEKLNNIKLGIDTDG